MNKSNLSSTDKLAKKLHDYDESHTRYIEDGIPSAVSKAFNMFIKSLCRYFGKYDKTSSADNIFYRFYKNGNIEIYNHDSNTYQARNILSITPIKAKLLYDAAKQYNMEIRISFYGNNKYTKTSIAIFSGHGSTGLNPYIDNFEYYDSGIWDILSFSTNSFNSVIIENFYLNEETKENYLYKLNTDTLLFYNSRTSEMGIIELSKCKRPDMSIEVYRGRVENIGYGSKFTKVRP